MRFGEFTANMPTPKNFLEQLRSLQQLMASGASTVWVATSPDGEGIRRGPTFVVPPTLSDVGGADASAETFSQILTASRSLELVASLASLNNLLELTHLDAKLERAAQEQYTRFEYRTHRKHQESTPFPASYPFIFNRVGVAIALKCALARLPGNSDLSDRNLVGDLVLCSNAFLNSSSFKELIGQPSDIEIAAELMPTWELTNSRDLAYGLARTYRMLELLAGNDPTVQILATATGLAAPDLTVDGIRLPEFVAIVFALYAHVKKLNADVLLNAPIETTIDQNRFFSETMFPRTALDSFFRSRSMRIAETAQWFRKDGPIDEEWITSQMKTTLFPTDFRRMREHPFLDIGNGRHILLDIQFLAELLFRGVYFTLFFSLPETQRENFASLWGRLLELDLAELLKHFYPCSAHILEIDVAYESGQIDAMLDFGSYIVLFEFKHFTLIHDAKFSHDPVLLSKALHLKLVENERGKPKAVRQLATSVEAIRKGTVPSAARGRGPEHRVPIYPVVVVADDGLEALGVNSFLNGVFQQFAVGGIDVKPLTLMSVQELEDVLPCTQAGHFTWKELLESRFDGSRVKLISVHQARYNLLTAQGIAHPRNKFRQEQFSKIYQEILARYKGE